MPSLLDFISAQRGQPNILGALQDEEFRNRIKQGLLDAANRGVVAGTLGGPVDLATLPINAARGLMGKAPIEKPVGGSEWLGGLMEKAGMVSPERNAPAELLAGIALPGAMAKGAAKVGPKVEQAVGKAAKTAVNELGPTVASRAENYMVQTGGILPATVWHGSPHKFDKFDASKIGTGEGAQAYGHGLYLAESPEVGADYANVLASPRNRVSDKRGVYIEPSPMGGGKYMLATKSEVGQPRGLADDATQFIYPDKEFPNLASAIKFARQKGLLSRDERPRLTAIGEDKKYVPVSKASDVEEPEYTQFIASDPGYLYKVDLPDEAIAKMLDWDKPLSEQAQAKAALERIGKEISLPRMQDAEGFGFAYQHLANAVGGPKNAAALLRNEGIPGIRYLDGGSRGAGQGTSNFVVFPGNEGLLKILERNGQRLEQPARPPFQYPQAEALETARKNAVTMLGLPENNTAMDRAKALGFDMEGVHFSRHGIDATELDSGKYAVAPFDAVGTHIGTKDAALDRFRNTVGTTDQIKGSTYPVLIKRGEQFVSPQTGGAWAEDNLSAALFERGGYANAKETFQSLNQKLRRDLFRGSGYDSIPYVNDVEAKGAVSYIVPPQNIRSRFAAFDPARVNENDLLGRADLSLLGALAAGGAGAAAANEAGLLDWLKRKKEK